MKMLYLSVHGILEYDEIRMFNEMGIEVFSPSGNYETPDKSSPFRPKIENLKVNAEDLNVYYNSWYLWNWNAICPKNFVDRFDVVYVMGNERFILHNWESFKHKPVIWRTIGQSNPEIEKIMGDLKKSHPNFKIVRYSPAEKYYKNYAGEDNLIRFGKRPDEWFGWNGNDKHLVTVVQSMKRRSFHCSWDIFEEVSKHVPCKLFGGDNPETEPPLNCGSPDYQQLKDVYRNHRAYFYAGTLPASYTLNFIEAWMTGIPIIALAPELLRYDTDGLYEIPNLIQHGFNGYIAHSVEEIIQITNTLFNDDSHAIELSKNGRNSAIKHFDESNTYKKWNDFLRTI